MDHKEEFCRIYRENIERSGAEQLLEWLGRTDFFTAPASGATISNRSRNTVL